MRRLWVCGCLLLALLPLQAFVFVPERGGNEPKWRVPATSSDPVRLVADAEANLYAADDTTVKAYEAGTGRLRWKYTAPPGFQVSGQPLPAAAGVVVVSRAAASPAETVVTMLGRAGDHGRPQVRWQRRALGVPPGGVYLPHKSDDPQAELGLVAVLHGRHIVLLALDSGEEQRSIELADIAQAPVWTGEWGIVAVAGQQPGVTAVRLTATASPAVHVRLGQEVTKLAWDDRTARLTMGNQTRSLYTAEFVLVPTRGPAQAKAVDRLEGSPDALLTACEDRLYLAAGSRVEARRVGVAAALWSYDAGPGWTLDGAVQATPKVVLAVFRHGEQTQIVGLAAGDGQVAWRHDEFTAVPVGGVHVPQRADASTDAETVAVLHDTRLELLNLSDGQSLWSRSVGRCSGPPLWVEDSGFVLTADGYQPDGATTRSAALVGFSLGANDRHRRWAWRVPEGETIDQVQWLAGARMLVIRGRKGLYVFE